MALSRKTTNREWAAGLQDVPYPVDTNDIPMSFYHYSWASKLCIGQVVTELGCGAGYGTRILSNSAKKCIGIDKNREAIKYAMRNFFLEGKTKFVIANNETVTPLDSDVIVSFNATSFSTSPSSSFLSSILTGASSHAVRTVILGMTPQDDSVTRDTLEALGRTCAELSCKYALFQQSAKNPESIEPLTRDGYQDASRIIAVIKSTPSIGEPDVIQADQNHELVSIIIPTYNRADLIEESIDSALGQTYPYIEVIVIDDGSTDNTRQVIAKYGDRIKYYQKENGGIGSALNFGIEKMNGRWFKWLSSDDVLALDAVQILVTFANETGAMIIYTDYDIIDEKSRFLRKFVEPHFASYYEFASALWTRFIGNGSSSLIEKSCFEEVGRFDEVVRSAEDYDWWLRACLLHGYRFFHIPQSTLKYRTHGKQLTAAVKHNAYATDEKIRIKIRDEIIRIDPTWWDTLVHYQKMYFRQTEHRGAARRMLRRSLLHMPEGVRKRALGAWHRSLKPRVDGHE